MKERDYLAYFTALSKPRWKTTQGYRNTIFVEVEHGSLFVFSGPPNAKGCHILLIRTYGVLKVTARELADSVRARVAGLLVAASVRLPADVDEAAVIRAVYLSGILANICHAITVCQAGHAWRDDYLDLQVPHKGAAKEQQQEGRLPEHPGTRCSCCLYI